MSLAQGEAQDCSPRHRVSGKLPIVCICQPLVEFYLVTFSQHHLPSRSSRLAAVAWCTSCASAACLVSSSSPCGTGWPCWN